MSLKPTRIYVPPAPNNNAKPPPRKRKPPREGEKPERATRPAAEAAPRPPPQPKPPPPPPQPPKPPQLQTPPGADYLLAIDRARLFTSPKLGPSADVVFKVAAGAHAGTVARGQFPLSGKGLAVLLQAALGETLAQVDEAVISRLVDKQILADVAHTGAETSPLALVRNIRARPT